MCAEGGTPPGAEIAIMECDEVRHELIGYLEQGLTPDKRRAVEDHLDHCYYCLEELREVEAVLKTCRRVLRHPYPRSRFERLVTQMHPAPAAKACNVARRYRQRRRRLMAAANVAVALAASLLLIATLAEPVMAAVNGFAALADQAAAELEPPTAESEVNGEPKLVAWRQRVLWANSLSEGPRLAEAPAVEEAPSEGAMEPVSWIQHEKRPGRTRVA